MYFLEGFMALHRSWVMGLLDAVQVLRLPTNSFVAWGLGIF